MPEELKGLFVPVVSEERHEKICREMWDDGFQQGQVSKEIKKQTKKYVTKIVKRVNVPKESISLEEYEKLRKHLDSVIKMADEQSKKSVSLEWLEKSFVPENVKLETVTDKDGFEWMFVEWKCPKCGNEFPCQGICHECEVKRIAITPQWVLAAENPYAKEKEDLFSSARKQVGKKEL